MEQEALGAPDVENPVSCAQAVEVPHALGDGHPAAIVAITAIALTTVPVEVLLAEALGHVALARHRRRPRGNVPLGVGVAVEQVDLAHPRAHRRPPGWPAAHPR